MLIRQFNQILVKVKVARAAKLIEVKVTPNKVMSVPNLNIQIYANELKS